MLDKNFRVVFSQSILDPANFEKYNIILFSQYESEKNWQNSWLAKKHKENVSKLACVL